MGLFKSSKQGKSESGLSLLQGLAILGVLGILAAALFKYLAA